MYPAPVIASLISLLGSVNTSVPGVDHASEQRFHENESKQHAQDARDAHGMMLHHGVASIEHYDQSALHDKESSRLSAELKRYKELEAKYLVLSKSARNSEIAEHYKKLVNHIKDLIESYNKTAALHKQLGELQKKLAQNNLETAEYSTHLKKSAQRSSEVHRQLAIIHKRFPKNGESPL
jgi:hypothetical protein